MGRGPGEGRPLLAAQAREQRGPGRVRNDSPAAGGAGATVGSSCWPSAQDRPPRRRPAGGAGFRGSAPANEGAESKGPKGRALCSIVSKHLSAAKAALRARGT